MQYLTTITQKGQLTIPKPLRIKYGLEDYSKVVIDDHKSKLRIKPTIDILELSGSIPPVKGKDALKARKLYENKYKRF